MNNRDIEAIERFGNRGYRAALGLAS